MYDADIREPLFDYLDEIYPKNRIFEEKIMGRSRADLVMIIQEGFIGLEIKSDADTYERLARQAKDYNRFCNYNYIVAGKSHEKHVAEHVPPSWGILIAVQEGETVKFFLQREALKNPSCKMKRQIEWMWRTELNHLLEKNNLPKYAGKSKVFVQNKLMEKVDEDQLLVQMVDELFERDYELWRREFEEYKAGMRRKKN